VLLNISVIDCIRSSQMGKVDFNPRTEGGQTRKLVCCDTGRCRGRTLLEAVNRRVDSIELSHSGGSSWCHRRRSSFVLYPWTGRLLGSLDAVMSLRANSVAMQRDANSQRSIYDSVVDGTYQTRTVLAVLRLKHQLLTCCLGRKCSIAL